MISKKEVQHISKLARLSLDKKEERKFQKDLSSILDYFNLLKKVNVSGVEPTFHPAERFFKKTLEVKREDEAKPQSPEMAKKLIEAAPQKKEAHIKVKAILR